jgi:hypothetical protein
MLFRFLLSRGCLFWTAPILFICLYQSYLALAAISENAYLQTVDLALCSGNLYIYTKGNRIQYEHLNPILSSRSDV